MQGFREIYVIESSAGVLLNSDGGVVIAKFDLDFAENSGEVAVAELARTNPGLTKSLQSTASL